MLELRPLRSSITTNVDQFDSTNVISVKDVF